MKRLFIVFFCFVINLSVAYSADDIAALTGVSKPWTFWYWMYGEVSEAGIEADLQAMKDANLGGFYLMPIKGKSDIPKNAAGNPLYEGNAEQLSPTWWKMVGKVYATAEKLGLEMGIHFCDGFALAGGPWITPEESMKRVVFSKAIKSDSHRRSVSDATVAGAKKGDIVLPTPEGIREDFYRDIAILAYPSNYSDCRTPKTDTEFPLKATEETDVVMRYDAPFTLRSVKVVTGGNNIQAHRWTLSASDDGQDYREVCRIEPARQGWQNTDAQATYSVPATTARYFKFHWSPEGSNPGAEDMDAAKWKPTLKLSNLILSSEPVIDGYEGKSAVVWRVSKENAHLSQDECVKKEDIIDITAYCNNGVFNINNIKDKAIQRRLKKGDWQIVRIGYTSTGHKNATGGGGRGLECDKFDRKAIHKQFENWWAKIYAFGQTHSGDQAAAGANKVLTRLHVDSWECGSQNWSENFAAEFKARRGYDLHDWLLLYAGVPVESSAKSDAVLRDVRTTIGELISDVFFGEMESYAREYGVKLSTECVAPTMVSDGLMHYKHSDYPMGEFWLNSPTHDKINDMLDAVSGAHIYGKNIVQAEGFTEVRGVWDEHPAMLKSLLDRNFCIGINSIVFHVMTHNPYMDRKPGMTLDGIGTFFQRDNTWWREMPAFTDYIIRCQSLLQYGKPVVDIAAYIGDEMPRRSIIPNRLTASLPGLFGEKNVAQERARLANEGQPMEVSPVGVNHTKNMVKADDFTNPLHGYKYDSFNHDVLATATVVNGKIRTAYGMEYSALLLPQNRPMNPNDVNKGYAEIVRLQSQGARIISKPWHDATLDKLGIPRDINLPEGVDYAHRHGEEADIYFISNLSDTPVTLNISDLKPRAMRNFMYIYDAVTDVLYKDAETLALNPGDSRFLILKDTEETPLPCLEKSWKSVRSLPSTVECRSEELAAQPWTITFEENGKTLETNELRSWTDYDDPEIKYYSGHAVYRTTYTVPVPSSGKVRGARVGHQSDGLSSSKRRKSEKGLGRYLLELESVRDIATVTVNGKTCGTVWRAPYTIDITEAMQPGINEIEISVVNTWANALLGNDLGTPPFPGIWTNGKYRRAEKTPIPAGLTGKVKLLRTD